MTPRDLRNIHTTRNSYRDALPCANMALKLPLYFYLLMEKPLGRYFQVRSPYYQATQYSESTYSCILKVTGQVWESQKRISINTNHSYHQHSSPWASLNWSNNKARFCFNQPNRKWSTGSGDHEAQVIASWLQRPSSNHIRSYVSIFPLLAPLLRANFRLDTFAMKCDIFISACLAIKFLGRGFPVCLQCHTLFWVEVV